MPYTHYTPDESNALQAMIAMALDRGCIAVILGKHLSNVYRTGGAGKRGRAAGGKQAKSYIKEHRSLGYSPCNVQKGPFTGATSGPVAPFVPR
ncbi:MAG: hypothetical protein LBQ30_05830 [Treponema sp.]|nr:hypothetical protein [Treponema sp.]